MVASVEDRPVAANTRSLNCTICKREAWSGVGVQPIVIVRGELPAALHVICTEEKLWEPSATATSLQVFAERPDCKDEVHLDDGHRCDKADGQDPCEATCEGAPVLLQYRWKHRTLVLDDEVDEDVSHVQDEADDGIHEIQPHVSFQPIHDSPYRCEDEGDAEQTKGRIEGLRGKVDVEPEGGDLENNVTRGSSYVEDVLHEVEKQYYFDPERQGATTAELIQWPDHPSISIDSALDVATRLLVLQLRCKLS